MNTKVISFSAAKTMREKEILDKINRYYNNTRNPQTYIDLLELLSEIIGQTADKYGVEDRKILMDLMSCVIGRELLQNI